ncbi:MAG: HDIG domain-containing protein [Prevotella sp.]|nr:HDIG domain-containing protein [Prevotella sp.]
MRNFNLKSDITWRDVALRVAQIIFTVAIIVWFMPRDNKPNFKMEVGKVWLYNDLTATFDFPVYKSDSIVQREREEVLRDFEPYYVYDNTVADRQARELAEYLRKEMPEEGSAFIRAVLVPLRLIYREGIVDTKEPLQAVVLSAGGDSVAHLRRIDNKEVTSVAASQVYTPRQAYEELVKSSLLIPYQSVLQRVNLNNYLVPNLTYDEDHTESARLDLLNSVPLSSNVVQSGQKIVAQGEVVTPQIYQVIESYLKEFDRRNQSQSGFSLMVVGEVLFVLLIVTLLTIYLTLYRKDFFEQTRFLGMVFTLLILNTVLASLMVSHSILHVYILPLAIVPIFVRVFMDSRTAIMTHLTVVLIIASILQKPLEFIGVEMAAGITAVYSLRELNSRSQLFWTAIITTMVAMLTNLAIFLIRHNDFTKIDSSEYVYLVICGIVVFCCYPLLYVIEKFFGFISDITLIELSDMNKDLLRRMSEVAPGTFQHSIQVGNLSAEIARKIGGNPQLVRTGALYHDIGKIQNPIYFTENQSGGINPHDNLSYIESAQMIISHVTEGLKLADKHNLPVQIRDLIATHHGQGKAKYFFIKYKNEHPDEPVDDLLFTYPGPNPFTKEQAILMMADAVEAASRSLPDYTEQSIRQLVNRVIDGMVSDGFFHECPITFRDIQYAKTVLIEKLKTIYHTRISYPEMKK